MIKENPFLGKGLGTFMDYYKKHKIPGDETIYYAHNCYLQIWAETGIFGLLSFLLFVGSVLCRRIKAIKVNSLPWQSSVLLGLISAVFGFLVHSFFDTNLYSLQLAVLFWFMLGLAVSITHSS